VRKWYQWLCESGIVSVVTDYQPRLIDDLLAQLLQELPALFLTGPRASGKTTTALRHADTVVRLDRAAEAVAFRADPDAALRDLSEPILLDEWQVVPEVIGAVKRSVDGDPRPSRFIVTGSVRSNADRSLWPGTGRLTHIPMLGMTVREQLGLGDYVPLLDRVASGADLLPAGATPDLRGYVELLLRSGFPEPALRLRAEWRERWLESYVEQLLTRDAEDADGRRDPARLRRYLEAYALNTAGIVRDTTLIETAGIDRKTALAYERLLSNLLVIESIPAWTSNRLKRLVLSPKRYVVDPAVAAATLGLDVDLVMRNGDLLGRLLDTFVVAQLRAELVVTDARPRLYHMRQREGRLEVDLLAELAGGRLVGLEVKADASPGPDSARHLAALRDRHPEAFMMGLVLHTGPRTYSLGDRLLAVPISTLWA
jgi:uncharacterized protein